MKERIVLLLMALSLCSASAWARVIQGFVYDASDKEPIVGASVLVNGTNIGAATDIDGRFQFDVPAKANTVTVSYVGMATQEVKITDNMAIYLTTAVENLDEVVVVAYGTQKKSSITGAISQVNAKDIETRPVSSVTAALEGSTSGVSVTGSYGQPGTDATISIRGVGTVTGSNSPLVVVDGVAYGGNISDLNPEDIESMSVLKDAASCALYGNRASNGVILITTKKSKSQRPTFTFKTNQGWYKRGTPEYDRVNPRQFMNIEYKNMFNGYLSKEGLDRTDPVAAAAAAEYVSGNIVKDRLITNIWNVGDYDLYGSDGLLVANASILPGYVDDLDWFDQGIRTGYRAEYMFTGSGGNDFSDYYFSVGYLDENGYMKDSGFSRLSGRAVVNIKPRSWFKSGLSVNASHQKINNTAGDQDGSNSTTTTNPFYFSRYIAPIYPVHLHDPATGAYMLDGNGNYMYDPGFYSYVDENGNTQEVATRSQLANNHSIWESEVNHDRRVRNTVNAIAYADFILPYGFTATIKGNLNTSNQERSSYGSSLIGGAAKGGAESGKQAKTIYNYSRWTLQQQVNWNQTYGKHFVNVLLGHENYSYSRDYTYARKTGVKVEGNESLSNFNTPTDINGYKDRYRTESYLARAQYNYDDRYNLEGSFRRDGSSRFASQSRWGNFGSIGANWVFTNEDFMKGVTWLTNGKLRANWGQVGNDQGSDYYAYYALYESGTKGGQSAYVMSQLAALDLKWETGESWGLGLEARLFNRWNLSVEYYDKRNKDLLFDVYNPISAGGTSFDYAESTITKNLGTISNRGIEINTDVNIFTNKDWTVNLAANLTTLSNKILKLPEQNKDGIVSGSYKIVEGRSRYEWYTYHWAGVDMLDGQSLYDANLVDYHIESPDGSIIGGSYDADGQLVSTALKDGDWKCINGKYYVNNTTYGEKDFRGTTLPKVYGSFTPSIRFRDFSLSAIFTYSLGGKVMDYGYSSLMNPSTTSVRNYHVDLLNSWDGAPAGMTENSADRINPNINPEINSSLSTWNNSTSDRWLVSRNYLALKNLNFAYRLPKSVTRVLDLSVVQFTFSAENVFTCTKRRGLQAQQSLSGGVYNSIPPARVFTFGLSVTL